MNHVHHAQQQKSGKARQQLSRHATERHLPRSRSFRSAVLYIDQTFGSVLAFGEALDTYHTSSWLHRSEQKSLRRFNTAYTYQVCTINQKVKQRVQAWTPTEPWSRKSWQHKGVYNRRTPAATYKVSTICSGSTQPYAATAVQHHLQHTT